MQTKQNRKWALKPEVGIFETRDPTQAEGKLLRIILSYSTALCMVWVKPLFDSNLRQKHPIFGLWEFLENSRGTLEGKFINVFDSARRALSDPKDSLVTKILLVVENFSLSQCAYIFRELALVRGLNVSGTELLDLLFCLIRQFLENE